MKYSKIDKVHKSTVDRQIEIDDDLVQQIAILLRDRLSNRLIADRLNELKYKCPGTGLFYGSMISRIINQVPCLKEIRQQIDQNTVIAAHLVTNQEVSRMIELCLAGQNLSEISSDVNRSKRTVKLKLIEASYTNPQIITALENTAKGTRQRYWFSDLIE